MTRDRSSGNVRVLNGPIDVVRGVLLDQAGIEIRGRLPWDDLTGPTIVGVVVNGHVTVHTVPHGRRVVLHTLTLAGTFTLELEATGLIRPIVLRTLPEVRHRPLQVTAVVEAYFSLITDTISLQSRVVCAELVRLTRTHQIIPVERSGGGWSAQSP